ncbi:unnamed protein product [Polarella glacialis]|uniref:EF-hand domain-containing protein n=1 Tax=Polarella glacialis TaxID=89957 RepID=A0A813FDU7_POLGL|nr:unnamed protein product [Polarella glacialis]CAE8684328.1 unnamed protein product [Polarella glacialis]|mmetsp:Transcript_14492/g.25978  ORF Transcript_14492/g.25978 Transcript_14492/m.25978 type:complete len:124 (-) Transcript_14492:89-460(-)
MRYCRPLLLAALLVWTPLLVFGGEAEDLQADADAAETNFREIIEEVDKDKDGKLSWTEMLDLDERADEDKELSPEIQSKYRKIFAESDKNGDSLIDMTEIEQLFAAFELADEEWGAEEGEQDL